MNKKFEAFISTLSDNEIDEQLSDIFGWAKEYQDLLEKERCKRRDKRFSTASDGSVPSENDLLLNDIEMSNEYAFTDAETSVDFYVTEQIQSRISGLSADETKERLTKLQTLAQGYLSAQEKAEIQFEIDTCEIHYFDLTGCTIDGANICPNCGDELEDGAAFCGKCGTKLS